MRAVVAQARRPVLLYSIGRDSSVMLRSGAQGVPSRSAAVTLLHLDPTWKLREMYTFRDRTARERGLEFLAALAEPSLGS